MATRIGTAGWSVPRDLAGEFPRQGSSLERYSARFSAVEVNSSFHRAHRPSTWRRWAEAVPSDFRFAVKIPKTITHERKLAECSELMRQFLSEVAGLETKLAVLLVQLPPKLAFDLEVAERFFELLIASSSAQIVCEPRHPSWFETVSDAFLRGMKIGRVAADPAPVPAAAAPGGWDGIGYWRLHGSPVMYRSSYDDGRLAAYGQEFDRSWGHHADTWCIFDNTASSAATHDALRLKAMLDWTSAKDRTVTPSPRPVQDMKGST